MCRLPGANLKYMMLGGKVDAGLLQKNLSGTKTTFMHITMVNKCLGQKICSGQYYGEKGTRTEKYFLHINLV